MEEETTTQKVPEITLSDNAIVLDTLEIDLVVNKETKKVVMQKLTAGKRRELIKKYVKVSIVGQQTTSTPDMASYQIGLLEAVIKEAPFEISFKFLDTMPESIVTYLYEQYTDWDQSEKKND